MATERMGRKKLLSKAGWVEVSVAPHGKRAALPRYTIEGVLESHVEGVGAFITYSVGNSVTNLPVLDLYLPLLHEVLESKKAPHPGWTLMEDEESNPADAPGFTYPDQDFPYPDNGDNIKAPQNT